MSNAAAATSDPPQTKRIERIPFGSGVQEVLSIIARDGGVILTGVLSKAQVDGVNRDLDSFFGRIAQGNFGEGETNFLGDFMGRRTKRVVHCVKHSKTYREAVVGSPVLADYIAGLVPGGAGRHCLISSHAIEIFPGETPQELHRDANTHLRMLDMYRKAGPEVLVNTILALVDVTEEMGATRVIPGSHLWDDFEAPGTQEETVAATMEAGDMLLFSGKVLHGGGANTTPDRSRRVLSTGFGIPFFVGEEAWPFVITVDEARGYPKQVQQLLGFRSISFGNEEPGFLWRVDAKPLEEKLGL